ncbi:MAG: hypothetical protein C0458_18645 [Methylobacterium sp.]|nr:hypothetical protein [Methylobacterium sp.]
MNLHPSSSKGNSYMFEDLYPATARAAKDYMAEHGGREAIPPVAAVDGCQLSASTAAVDGMPLRLTIDLPPECASEVVIRLGRSGNPLTVTLNPNGGAARPSRLEGAR